MKNLSLLCVTGLFIKDNAHVFRSQGENPQDYKVLMCMPVDWGLNIPGLSDTRSIKVPIFANQAMYPQIGTPEEVAEAFKKGVGLKFNAELVTVKREKATQFNNKDSWTVTIMKYTNESLESAMNRYSRLIGRVETSTATDITPDLEGAQDAVINLSAEVPPESGE